MNDASNDASVTDEDGQRKRAHWMGVLAKARADELSAQVDGLGGLPPFSYIRPPEPGSVMVQGRAGGDGAPFSLGEMTLTRCAVRLHSGAVGHAYVQGRNTTAAEQAAVLDALLQDDARYEELRRCVVEPLENLQLERGRERARKAANTKVEFFTMVRGDNPQ